VSEVPWRECRKRRVAWLASGDDVALLDCTCQEIQALATALLAAEKRAEEAWNYLKEADRQWLDAEKRAEEAEGENERLRVALGIIVDIGETRDVHVAEAALAHEQTRAALAPTEPGEPPKTEQREETG
jgi:hypothetical protein